MRFDELIRLKALQLKAQNTGQNLMETVGEQLLRDPEVTKELKLRQVCAMLPPVLFEKLEATCEMLGVTKRKFMEGALIEALDRAEAIVAEVDPFEGVAGEDA
jgi:hypothetical protein